MKTVLNRIAHHATAWANCTESGNTHWQAIHERMVDYLVAHELPAGSGIDAGTQFEIGQLLERSTTAIQNWRLPRLTFTTAFHHMNEAGYYDGWTEHKVIVRADLLMGYTLDITGRDRNQIKEYLADLYQAAFDREVSAQYEALLKRESEVLS